MKSKFFSQTLSTLTGRLIREESGAELVEVVLVIGLIAVICLAAVAAVGPKIGIRWNDVSSSIGSGDQ